MTCRSLTSSPWTSLMTWTAPLGRVSSALSRAISARAASGVWRSGGPAAAARPDRSRSWLDLDPHPEVARLAGRHVHPALGVHGVVGAVERLQADEVACRAATRAAGAASRARSSGAGRRGRARRSGRVRSTGASHAEVELAVVRELLRGPQAGHVARDLAPWPRPGTGSTDASRARRAGASGPGCARRARPAARAGGAARRIRRRTRTGYCARVSSSWTRPRRTRVRALLAHRPRPCCGRSRAASSACPRAGTFVLQLSREREEDGDAAAHVLRRDPRASRGPGRGRRVRRRRAR